MAQLTEFPASFRLRGTYDDYKGLWVATMTVTKGGKAVSSPKWRDLDHNPFGHRFHPLFIESEADAYLFIDLSVAQAWRRIISRKGIETEVVPVKPVSKA
jgi:hypothetical protein